MERFERKCSPTRQNMLLFGATGVAGRAITGKLAGRGFPITAVLCDESKARALLPEVTHFVAGLDI